MDKYKRIMLCSDLDRTIIPNGHQEESGLARPALRVLASRPEIHLVYVTGRDRQLISEAIRDYDLPVPEDAIGDVGTSIYKISGSPVNLSFSPLQEWQEEISGDWGDWSHRDIAGLFSDLDLLRYQEEEKQNEYKVSYYVDADADRASLAGIIENRLNEKGIRASVISSVDEENHVGLIDILPGSATKVHAIRFLMKKYEIPESGLVFSGDSGNDLPALTSGLQAVLVRNAAEDVRSQAAAAVAEKGIESRLYFARGDFLGMNGNYAAGVLEGLSHFMPWTEPWVREAIEIADRNK